MITAEEHLPDETTGAFAGTEALPIPPHGRRDSPALTLPSATPVSFLKSLP